MNIDLKEGDWVMCINATDRLILYGLYKVIKTRRIGHSGGLMMVYVASINGESSGNWYANRFASIDGIPLEMATCMSTIDA